MKLPNFRRLIKTDFPQNEQNLVEKIASSLNYGLEVVYEALNNKISLQDNILCTVKDLQITVNASGIPIVQTSFRPTFPGTVIGLQVIKADNLTNTNTYPSSGISVSFVQTDTGILINHITGLQANNTYQLRIVAYG